MYRHQPKDTDAIFNPRPPLRPRRTANFTTLLSHDLTSISRHASIRSFDPLPSFPPEDEFELDFQLDRRAEAMAPSENKYSVILPTYNERRNLPIVTWLLNRTFTEK